MRGQGSNGGLTPLTGAIEDAARDDGAEDTRLLGVRCEVQAADGEFDGNGEGVAGFPGRSICKRTDHCSRRRYS